MIQLRIRTEYSFGKTFAPVNRVANLGHSVHGIVDSSTWGHVAFYNACEDTQPLLGVESIVSDSDSTLKMWFLARNTEGLSELYRAISKAYQQRLGASPRLFRSDIKAMSDRIIKFAGEITDGPFLKEVGAYIDLNPSSMILNAKKRQIAEAFDLSLVSTSDNTYLIEDDKAIFDLFHQSKTTPQHILTELEHQFEASQIAAICDDLTLPKAPMLDVEGDLELLCFEGIKRRMGDRCENCDCRNEFMECGNGDTKYFFCNNCNHEWTSKWTREYAIRLDYELDLIRSKNFESYFIIVADMVRYAKQHMLVGPSRGSAAGSLVCYLLGITEIDPIPAGLFFERFIDENRTDLPDIDLDFPDKKRQMVFDYMAEKYGRENVAHLGTITKYRAKSALDHIGKILRIPFADLDEVKSVLVQYAPGDARYNKSLEDTFKDTDIGRKFITEHPEAQAAAQIEGHASHTGVHAAGLLVCGDKITNYAVVDHKGIAHVEKEAAEQLGLLKIDVLGLRTLGILEELDIDWYSLKFNDQKVFDVFNSGRLCGIFQFEGNAMRGVSKSMEFHSIEDLCIAVALARPGPLNSGIDKKFFKGGIEAIHPSLKNTRGLPIYQEQTMAIVHDIGGFDWTDTIAIRKLISKSKGKEAIDDYLDQFIEGSSKQGFDEIAARKLWNTINEMGSYQMNKAHTFSYAVISYWTAYFKAHHPLEFTAACLRNAKNDDSAILLLREMYREGFEHIPFDIEKSEANWCVKDGKLYGGFTALRGVGKVKAERYIGAREEGKLTDKQRAFLLHADNTFGNIFPFHTNYQHLYDDPDGNDIASKIVEIADINEEGMVPHLHERVFLAELTEVKYKSENDPARVKKRNHQLMIGPMNYIDVRLRDDSGMIGGRIGRYDISRLGNLPPIGSHLLIRAVFYNNIPWAFIQKWRRIDE